MKDCLKQVGNVEAFMCATVCAGLPNCRLKNEVIDLKQPVQDRWDKLAELRNSEL